MATPSSSNSPPPPPTPATVIALRVLIPVPRDSQSVPPQRRPVCELPPEWQWQRYLDLSG